MALLGVGPRGWCLALPSEGRCVIVSSIVDARGTISTTTTKDEGQFSTSQKERNGKARKGEDGKGQAQPKRGGGEARPLLGGRMGRPGHAKRKGEGQARSKKERKEKGEARPGPIGKGGDRPDPRVKEGKIGVLVVSFCAQSSLVTIVFFMILFFIIFCLYKFATIFPTHGVNYNVVVKQDAITQFALCRPLRVSTFFCSLVMTFPLESVGQGSFTALEASSDCVMVLVMGFVLSSFCFFMLFCHVFFFHDFVFHHFCFFMCFSCFLCRIFFVAILFFMFFFS